MYLKIKIKVILNTFWNVVQFSRNDNFKIWINLNIFKKINLIMFVFGSNKT
jgi:hypothetical protein